MRISVRKTIPEVWVPSPFIPTHSTSVRCKDPCTLTKSFGPAPLLSYVSNHFQKHPIILHPTASNMSMNKCEQRDGNLDGVQRLAMEALRNGKTMEILGGAGTGKTLLLRHILKEASYSLGSAPYVVACAYSNRTASVLNGRTIHSLFAAPANWPFQVEKLLSFVSKKTSVRQSRLRLDLRVLVIDEISHITCRMLDSVDGVLREFAVPSVMASLPFGGRHVVLAGDPFQLEAIPQRLATAE